jgi:CHASE2 domain-containing sensor protein/signal transduction histidine kinase
MAAHPPVNKNQRQFPVSERYLFAAVLTLLSSLLLFSGWTQRLDYIIYDTFLKLHPITTTTSSIVVAIDEKSLNDLGQWPWDRAVHAQLISKLKAAGAEAIIFDILLTENSSTLADQLLQQQMQMAGNVLLPLHIDNRSGSGRMTEILPTPDFVASVTGLGHAHFELDEDGIARGLYLYQGLGDSHWPSLALAAFEFINRARSQFKQSSRPGSERRSLQPQAVKRPPASGPSTNTSVTPATAMFNVREAYRLIPFVGPPGSFATLSYSEVLKTELPPDYFAGRVVFVGATAAGLGDFIATPVSGELANMAGVEVHANVYEALVNNNLTVLLARPWQYALTLCLVLTVAMLFPRISPGKNLPLAIVCCLLVCAFSYLQLLLQHQWFAPASLLITLLFAYPFWSWRRLLRLNRFLNQELKRLADEPRLRLLSSYQSPQQWAQQLVRLLKPECWEFRSYKKGSEPQFELDEQQHSAEIYLPVHDQNDLAALYMRFEAPPDQLMAIINYADQLFPEFQAGLPKHAAPGELMDRRIVQVRRAIAAMRDMRQFISDTVANMPDGVLVGDEFGRIMFLNDPARHWLQEDAQTGSFIAEVMPVTNRLSAGRWEVLIRNVLINEKPQAEELHMESTAVLTTLAPIKFTNKSRGMVITFADITVIHEAQLKRMETIHFISHDLRAPLASQLALLDTLRQSLPDEFESSLVAAQNLTEKSLLMADQFLQLARVESADHIHMYECDLLDIVDNAVDSTTPLAQQGHIHINTSVSDDAILLTGNPELLERCLVNLLQNAIKFSPARSSIDIQIGKQDKQAVIVVQDHGQGIDAQEIPYLFEPYRRTRASESQGIAGSGLGLRFVKLVTERHGGDISVSSQTGAGSSFTLCLPLHSVMADEDQEQVIRARI